MIAQVLFQPVTGSLFLPHLLSLNTWNTILVSSLSSLQISLKLCMSQQKMTGSKEPHLYAVVDSPTLVFDPHHTKKPLPSSKYAEPAQQSHTHSKKASGLHCIIGSNTVQQEPKEWDWEKEHEASRGHRRNWMQAGEDPLRTAFS